MARLEHVPFAVDLHARTVARQMDRVAVVNDRQLDLECLRAKAQRRVAWYRQGSQSQIAQALRETLPSGACRVFSEKSEFAHTASGSRAAGD
ncbi:hypothetical protein WS87_31205 [Burkholderia sp. MSMB0856]|nr:hypothetical protein WS87_31205 [Burkholderia sp. MSMB0856]KVH27961.1 hypothetical protein WS87_29840 [Burkholderia sp. MSMB0856]